jgi:hypothetical protein
MNGFGQQPAFGTNMPWGATATLSPTIRPPSLAHAVFGSPAPQPVDPFNDPFQQGQLLTQLLDELKRPRQEPRPVAPQKKKRPLSAADVGGYGAPPEMGAPGGLTGSAMPF